MGREEWEELQNWRSVLASRVDELERRLEENTEATKRVEDNTKEAVEILRAWKGAMKVLEFLAKLVKLLTTPLGVIAAAVGAYITWKGGK